MSSAPPGGPAGADDGSAGADDASAAAEAISALAQHGVRMEEVEELVDWRTNAPLLYDLYVACGLEWPALSVAWLPDEADEPCRVAIGLHTDGSVHHEVVVAELRCSTGGSLDADPWRSWQVPGFADMEGFGCDVDAGSGAAGPLRDIARMAHPTEVNRVLPCPGRGQLLATKAASGAVLLFDYKAERPAGVVAPDAELRPPSGEAVDGFALDWGVAAGGGPLVASGGNDGRLCVWEVEAAPKAKATCCLLDVAEAHAGALCGVAFARGGATSAAPRQVLASVGDDGFLRLWDARAGPRATSTLRASSDDVLCVDWSYSQEHLLATCGKDRAVCVWDARSWKAPCQRLEGHEGDVVVVRWAPFRSDLLASCSTDRRLNLWDLSADVPVEDDPGAAKELIFSHASHGGGVSDFSWSDTDEYLICSVADDNGLHLWQPSSEVYMPDDEAGECEAEEPAAKRSRTEGAD